jgi:hypothetical protein
MKHYKSFSQTGVTEQFVNSPPRSATQYTPVSDIPTMQELAPRQAMMPGLMKHRRMQDRMDQYYNQGEAVTPFEPIQPMGLGEGVSCKQFAKHVADCKSCYKLYKRNKTQGALIIFLVFIIILLLTRLMDKN